MKLKSFIILFLLSVSVMIFAQSKQQKQAERYATEIAEKFNLDEQQKKEVEQLKLNLYERHRTINNNESLSKEEKEIQRKSATKETNQAITEIIGMENKKELLEFNRSFITDNKRRK